MNDNRKTEIQVGIAVILGVVILVLGIMWIGQARIHGKWDTYNVYFDEVGGLGVGDPVNVSGLELGRVSAITIEDGKVRAAVQLEKGTALREDYSAEIRSSGLLGEKYLHILPGKDGELLTPGSSLYGKYKAGLPELLADAGDVMRDVREATQALKKIVGAGEGTKGLGVTLAKVDATLNELTTLLKENRGDIRSSARNIESASRNINRVIVDHRDEISEGIVRFRSATMRLDSLATALSGIVNSIERGEGSLGMLIKERRLHEELDATLENLNLLIKDIKEHPERYFKVSIF